MRFGSAIFGGILGGIIGKLPGAILGFLIGLFLEFNQSRDSEDTNQSGPKTYSNNYSNKAQEYHISWLLRLIAHVMKADGQVLKSELTVVKQMLANSYGEEKAKAYLLELRDILKETYDVSEICRHLRIRISYNQRLDILRFLFRVSNADGHSSINELQVLRFIATHMGLTEQDFISIKGIYVNTVDADYQILGVGQNTSEELLKKAYRKKAMEYHPDRLHGMTDAEKKMALSNFQKVQQAYENIKKKRGWN